MATEVDKPGDEMRESLQELLQTGEFVIVLARQLASAMLHAVRRRQNALIVMQMAKTADKLREQNVRYVRGYSANLFPSDFRG